MLLLKYYKVIPLKFLSYKVNIFPSFFSFLFIFFFKSGTLLINKEDGSFTVYGNGYVSGDSIINVSNTASLSCGKAFL